MRRPLDRSQLAAILMDAGAIALIAPDAPAQGNEDAWKPNELPTNVRAWPLQ